MVKLRRALSGIYRTWPSPLRLISGVSANAAPAGNSRAMTAGVRKQRKQRLLMICSFWCYRNALRLRVFTPGKASQFQLFSGTYKILEDPTMHAMVQQIFRVPLYAHQPLAMGVLKGLHKQVIVHRTDPQALSEPLDGLAVNAIGADMPGSGNTPQPG